MYSNIPEIRKLDNQHIRGIKICYKIQGKIDNVELYNLANVSDLLGRRKVHLRNVMFKNKDKCEPKPENAIVTRGNSGPTFKITKPNNEVYKRNVTSQGERVPQSIEIQHFQANIKVRDR